MLTDLSQTSGGRRLVNELNYNSYLVSSSYNSIILEFK